MFPQKQKTLKPVKRDQQPGLPAYVMGDSETTSEQGKRALGFGLGFVLGFRGFRVFRVFRV